MQFIKKSKFLLVRSHGTQCLDRRSTLLKHIPSWHPNIQAIRKPETCQRLCKLQLWRCNVLKDAQLKQLGKVNSAPWEGFPISISRFWLLKIETWYLWDCVKKKKNSMSWSSFDSRRMTQQWRLTFRLKGISILAIRVRKNKFWRFHSVWFGNLIFPETKRPFLLLGR